MSRKANEEKSPKDHEYLIHQLGGFRYLTSDKGVGKSLHDLFTTFDEISVIQRFYCLPPADNILPRYSRFLVTARCVKSG